MHTLGMITGAAIVFIIYFWLKKDVIPPQSVKQKNRIKLFYWGHFLAP